MNKWIGLAVGLNCLVLTAAFILGGILSPDFGSWDKKISGYYITDGWKELKATNTVTTIVWDFRSYDTLGEESVLFTAVIGIITLGFGQHSKHKVHHKVE